MIGRITVRRDEVTVEPDPSAKLTPADLKAAYEWAHNVARLMGWAHDVSAPRADVIGVPGRG